MAIALMNSDNLKLGGRSFLPLSQVLINYICGRVKEKKKERKKKN